MPIHTLRDIDRFLACERIALIGLSRDPNDFSRKVFDQLIARGYDVIPVNPKATEIAERPCYPSVRDVQPRAEAALIMTGAEHSAGLVAECDAAGIRHVWLQRSAGRGSVSEEAVQYCIRRGLSVVAGECPLMFLSETEWPHRLHGFIRKVTGVYPRARP